jgi:hypothetical protein
MNKEGEWALQNYNIYEQGLGCIQFRGGLPW